MSDTIDDMAAALAAYGVHEGYPSQRSTLASSLILSGISTSDVDVLAAFVQRNKPRSKPEAHAAALAAILADPAERKERLDDIRFCASKRAEKQRNPFDTEECRQEFEDIDEIERAVRVAIRVDECQRWVGDRRTTDVEALEAVADEFGLDMGLASHLLAIGRQRLPRLSQRAKKGGKTKTPDDPAKDHAERVARFRRLMAWVRERPGRTMEQAKETVQ